jgi:hypothetical protein
MPDAWKSLFDHKNHDGIDPIQLALAGMVAHINHDLSYALHSTDRSLGINPDKNSPQYADFEYVNKLLAKTLPEGMRFLNKGILGELADDTSFVGNSLAMLEIEESREIAWAMASTMNEGPSVKGFVYEALQEQVSGLLADLVLFSHPTIPQRRPHPVPRFFGK